MPQREILIEIDGVEEVAELFRNAPKESIPSALLKALSEAGRVIEEYMAGRTPDKTGELLANLDISVTLDSDFRGGYAEIGFSGEQGHVARFVEFGHRMVGHKPDKKLLGQVEPHPFMRPAADASAEEALDVFVGVMMAELQKSQLLDAA